MYWINIDIPTKRFVVHHDPGCRHVFEMAETDYKGVEGLKRDGGWIKYESYLDARKLFDDHFSDYKLVQCCV